MAIGVSLSVGAEPGWLPLSRLPGKHGDSQELAWAGSHLHRHGPARPGHRHPHVPRQMARTSQAMTVEKRSFSVRHLILIRMGTYPAMTGRKRSGASIYPST